MIAKGGGIHEMINCPRRFTAGRLRGVCGASIIEPAHLLAVVPHPEVHRD